jgi:endonuclease YncB( thermonuclease family)
VINVRDGDSITVVDSLDVKHRIRLAGIDAPELNQPYGHASQQALSSLLIGKVVYIQWSKKDRNGRLVGKVMVNGQDANLLQLQAGLAWHYKAFAAEQSPAEREKYSSAESRALTARRGIWFDPNPVAPWDYRNAARLYRR